jgi:hypothetical protein
LADRAPALVILWQALFARSLRRRGLLIGGRDLREKTAEACTISRGAMNMRLNDEALKEKGECGEEHEGAAHA